MLELNTILEKLFLAQEECGTSGLESGTVMGDYYIKFFHEEPLLIFADKLESFN